MEVIVDDSVVAKNESYFSFLLVIRQTLGTFLLSIFSSPLFSCCDYVCGLENPKHFSSIMAGGAQSK